MRVTYVVRAKGNEQYDVFKNGRQASPETQLRQDQRFYTNSPKEFADFRRKLDQEGEAKIAIEVKKKT